MGHDSPRDRIRVGLVGAGGVGARHARTLAGFPDVELVGLADAVPGAADALAAELGVPVARDADELLAHDLDGIWLCVPPFAHGELELAAVRAGVPFLVEKPLATGVAVAEQVARAVAAAGLPTATGYHWRHLDTVAAARAVCAAHRPRLVDATWLDRVPPPAWWSRRERSGGQVVEQLTHVLDLARLLAGEVVEVRATAAPSGAEGRDVDDATAALLAFDSGAVGTVTAACSLPGKLRAGLDVVCDGAAVELTETSLTVTTAEGATRSEPRVDARTAVDRAFLDVLAGGAPAEGLVDYAEALRTHRVAVAIAESARSGDAVRP
ncbi:Gfo/Idh/MocA family protein [Geodermatophilus sp. DSM 44513]|uniref:Gfo/Idh/MocA family protein n=1 Tax=Geodermatophilus sp. DSM 44513 TaxID=1528104 RepID=UPI0012701A84|nr:Gfo/Idh/MocA family oxidoreductase [Geodermatophilus sp. DSM 44513]WNV75991.1 Gfo/Idh/MocA family oxidoreductase [Geodermatophilus sp. DSM 44513]